jgi:hypothetical protein
MPQNGVVTQYDDLGFSLNPTKTTSVTFAGGTVKSGAGRLAKVIITTAFAGVSGLLSFYDNAAGTATGTPLLTIPVAAGLAGAVFAVDLPVTAGISAVNTSLTAGAVTVAYT